MWAEITSSFLSAHEHLPGTLRYTHIYIFPKLITVVNRNVCKMSYHNNKFFFIQILSSDGNQEVGVITRQWPGLFETFFNFEARHTFGISCKLYCMSRLVVVQCKLIKV